MERTSWALSDERLNPQATTFPIRVVHHGRVRWVIGLLLILLTACTSPDVSQNDEVSSCEPSRTEVDPLIGVEVRARGASDVSGWALVFARWPIAAGDPLTIPSGEETKVVWRLTGEGDVSFRALGPDGEVEATTWGPDPHGGSNWDRPGDEWGTGWILPSAGCWTLEVTRGPAVQSISAEVT